MNEILDLNQALNNAMELSPENIRRFLQLFHAGEPMADLVKFLPIDELTEMVRSCFTAAEEFSQNTQSDYPQTSFQRYHPSPLEHSMSLYEGFPLRTADGEATDGLSHAPTLRVSKALPTDPNLWDTFDSGQFAFPFCI